MNNSTIRVLLIEDDEDDLFIIQSMLSAIGSSKVNLSWANNYESGLNSLQQDQHDVVLLDYLLGGKTGLDLLREVDGKSIAIPVILLTGQGGYEIDIKAMEAGASDYLIKGHITPDLLERSIRYAIAGKQSELELKNYRHRLEELVGERTKQLESANDELREEIAERKRAEENLKEQKEFLATVIESLHHPFYVLDANDYTIRMANSAAVPADVSPNTSCRTPYLKASEICDSSNHLCSIETIKRTKKPLITEHIHYDLEGEIRNLEIHGHPILDENGNVVQIIEYSHDITERKKIEKDLKRARDELVREKSLLQAVLNQMPAGIIVAEPSGRIILSNQQSTEILETPQQYTGHIEEYADYRSFHSDWRPYDPNTTPLRRSLRHGEIVRDEEILVVLPDRAKSKIILASSSPVRDSEQNIVAAVVTFQDISERKKEEEELYRREQEYRALVENSPDVVMRVDREFRRIFCNKTLEKVTGFPISSFVGSTIYEPPKKDRAEYVSRMEKACTTVLSTGEEEAFEFPYPTTKGTRYFQMRVVPEYSKEGRIESLLTIARDVSELRRIQEELRAARDELELRVQERTAELAESNKALRLDEARLEALLALNHMSDASTEDIADFTLKQLIGLTRSQIGAIGFLNEEETIFSLYSCTAGLSGSCCTEKPLQFAIKKFPLFLNAVKTQGPIVVDEPIKSNLQEICSQLPIILRRHMSVPVVDSGRVVAIAITANKDGKYDPSDARQASLLLDGMWKLVQRSKAQKALLEAESLAAMGRALSAVAHDIKTPLIAIGGFTRIVHGHLPESSADRSKLEIVIKEVRRLEVLLKEMLDFSRPLELDKSLHNLNDVILESQMMVENAARERGVSIENHLADLPLISFDSMRMKQVIINLVNNAIQASSPGKAVSISTEIQGKIMHIDVRDQGCGIPGHKREEIFAPFVTTKKEGTGLGLPICKKIVEAHEWVIQILDNPDEGVTFRICIPAGELTSEKDKAA